MKLTGCILIGIYLLGWYFQNNVLFNSDTSLLIEASRRMLAGGSYTKDFFEINPPMILYVYMPVVAMAKWFSLPYFMALRICVYLLATLSLMLSLWLLRFMMSDNAGFIRSLLLMVIAAAYLILPLNEFGQREHVMMMLTLPYFLLMAVRLYGHHFRSPYLPMFIGIMAGIGFAIKPYFILPFVLIELYFMIKQSNRLSWLRTEVYGVITVMVVYLGLVMLFHQDYLTVILPKITAHYYQHSRAPINIILFSNEAFYFYFAALLYVIQGRRSVYSGLATVLMLAAFGFYLAYVLQMMYWYYHMLPMLSLSILLLTLLFSSWITQEKVSKNDLQNIGIYALLLLSYIVYRINYMWLGVEFYPHVYFGFFTILIVILLSVAYGKKHLFKACVLSVGIIAFNDFFYHYLKFTVWEHHLFALTLLMLFLTYTLCIPYKKTGTKVLFSFYGVIGTLLFAYPFYLSASIYAAAVQLKSQYEGLLYVLNTYPGKSVVMMTDSCQLSFPALQLTHHPLASRFACMMGLPLIPALNEQTDYVSVYAQHKNTVDFYVDLLSEDMIGHQPDLIFVDMRGRHKTHHLGYYGNVQMDYLQLFQFNPHFKAAWKPYHYVKTVDGQPLFKFSIYERGDRTL